MSRKPLLATEIPGIPHRRGKVRDIYDLGDRLVIIASDRISAFDWVLPTPIPDKGRVLTGLTVFWLRFLNVPNHLISTRLEDMGPQFVSRQELLEGRAMLVRKAQVIPIECVARGYLAGSAWSEYKQNGTVCGIPLPAGLVESQQLPEPIFTPATKEETGHDTNISFEEMVRYVGRETAEILRQRTLSLYRQVADYAKKCGILVADTKLEWGYLPDGQIILIDEVFTPDSSRFWPADQYRPGSSPPSFDKQFVRDWLQNTGWDKNSPPPPLPPDVVEKTRSKYIEAYERLTGECFPYT